MTWNRLNYKMNKNQKKVFPTKFLAKILCKYKGKKLIYFSFTKKKKKKGRGWGKDECAHHRGFLGQ